eukprot:scaffold23747_cov58-Phaeocystis_antarctica.AAC.2
MYASTAGRMARVPPFPAHEWVAEIPAPRCHSRGAAAPITSLTSPPLYYLTPQTGPSERDHRTVCCMKRQRPLATPPCSLCEGLHETAAGKAFSGRTRLQEHPDLLHLAAMCALGLASQSPARTAAHYGWPSHALCLASRGRNADRGCSAACLWTPPVTGGRPAHRLARARQRAHRRKPTHRDQQAKRWELGSEKMKTRLPKSLLRRKTSASRPVDHPKPPIRPISCEKNSFETTPTVRLRGKRTPRFGDRAGRDGRACSARPPSPLRSRAAWVS